MIKKHLTTIVIVAVVIIIFHSSILNALTSFLLAGVVPLISISLPSWMMFLLASITLVMFLRWLTIYRFHINIPPLQTFKNKKERTKNANTKPSRAKPKPAS